MTCTRLTTAALTALAAGALIASLATPALAEGEGKGLTAAGLTSGGTKITTLSTGDGRAAKQVKLTGLTGDNALVGIDYRPQDDLLYGVGDGGGLYEVDPVTGAAELVGQLTVALEGSSFGVDFNPAANALRVISDSGQNLRQPFALIGDGDPRTAQAATVRDGDLNYGGTQTSAGTPTTGGASTGGSPALGVTGAAYTNNDADGAPAPAGPPANGNTGTALYDIDTTKDVLALQNANPGILTQVGAGLGVDTSDVVGFDIYSTIGENGKAVAGQDQALAILTVLGERALYRIDLTTGAATFLRGVTRGVSDLAIATDQ